MDANAALNVSSADQIATLQGQVADALKQVADLGDEVEALEAANVCCDDRRQLLDVGNSSDMNIGAAC
jgi:hypothetical protein